jgi:hypothetical protein
MANSKDGPPVPVWKGVTYARVAEGRYQAVALRHQGPEWIRAFSRWSLLLEFELLDDGSRICVFYNMGNDPKGPTVTRRGKYFAAWTQANGEMPCKGEPMTPDIFLEDQVYTVEVKDCRRNAKEQEKADAEIYSVVSEIVSVSRSPILNHSIRNQESHNQPIMQSTNQVQAPRATARQETSGGHKFASAGRR